MKLNTWAKDEGGRSSDGGRRREERRTEGRTVKERIRDRSDEIENEDKKRRE